MSTVTYRYTNSLQRKVDGTSQTIKESIIDGEKGLSFTFTKKMGEKDFYKLIAKEVENDKFMVVERMDDKKNDQVKKESEMTSAELMKMIKSNKDLKFVVDYMTKEKKKQKGGAYKKSSKKGSKKGSKKAAKKGSKKAAKKGSKRATKKGSKKGSKKAAKKATKKGSKKGSKKAAKKASKKGSKKATKKAAKKTSKSRKGTKKGSKKRSTKKSA